MKPTATTECRRARADIDRHFAGRAHPDGERRLRLHLDGCAACRGYYDRHLVLARLDPRAPSQAERLGRGLGLAAAPTTTRRWRLPVGAAAVACACVFLLWLGPLRPRSSDSGFIARGGAPVVDTNELRIYRARPGTHPQPIGATMAADDELAFSYRNPEHYGWLLIFAVDNEQHYYWYYPAWTDAHQDPHAVAIADVAGVTELGDAVAQPIAGAELQVCGVFVHEPLTVTEVERRLRAHAELGGRQRCQRLTVEHR